MVKKLIIFAITSGLAAKLYMAYADKKRAARSMEFEPNGPQKL